MPVDSFNFGKERYIYTRARDYIFNLTFLFQQATNIVVWMTLGKVTVLQTLLFGIPTIVFFMFLFWRFMRFDVKKNIPAEFAWTWRVNPAYQEMLNEIKKLRKELEQWKSIVKNAEDPVSSRSNNCRYDITHLQDRQAKLNF